MMAMDAPAPLMVGKFASAASCPISFAVPPQVVDISRRSSSRSIRVWIGRDLDDRLRIGLTEGWSPALHSPGIQLYPVAGDLMSNNSVQRPAGRKPPFPALRRRYRPSPNRRLSDAFYPAACPAVFRATKNDPCTR